MNQTEVQRIERELVRSNVSGDALLRKFRSASRGDIKLACALHGFFEENSPEYLPYLQSRIRPAAAELILTGRIHALSRLDALGLFTQPLTEELLELAISARVPDSIIWLLKMKERRYGFSARELIL